MRYDEDDQAEFAQDSFLDVVANIVGVLIILVMLVGAAASGGLLQRAELARADSTKLQIQSETRRRPEALKRQLEKVEERLVKKSSDFRETTARILRIGHQSARQEQLRLELAVHRAAIEEDLQRRRAALSAEDRQSYDVQNQIFEAKLELDKLSDQQLSLLAEPGVVNEIVVEPTPVARKVTEDAIHVRLKGGAVCKVPFHELMEEVEYEAVSIKRELNSHDGVNRVVGPIDGFRLRVTVDRRKSSSALTGPIAGNISARTRYDHLWEFHPIAKVLGEPMEQASLADSRFRQTLELAKRRSSVVVAWVYNDSFDDYRVLRKMLADMGFSIAVFNLADGDLISASPRGRRAHAQ
ncbi:MAG: hypothetical protein AAGD11_10070 [Planctomycetota bacterium]